MKVWVTRNRSYDSMKMFIQRPIKANGDYLGVNAEQPLMMSGMGWFKKFFGFTPRKGSCKQYGLTLKEIE